MITWGKNIGEPDWPYCPINLWTMPRIDEYRLPGGGVDGDTHINCRVSRNAGNIKGLSIDARLAADLAGSIPAFPTKQQTEMTI